MTTKRTTHRSTAGKKLYAVHAKDGKPKDVQTFKRSSRQDQQVTTVEEATRVLVAKARAFKRNTTIVAEYTFHKANAALIAKLDPDTVAELCRLARLGMRVEEAPKTRAKITPTAWRGPTWLEYESLPNEWGGKRVALVVLEDSK